MGNPLDRVWQFVTSGNRSKLLGIIALVGLLAAIPISVKVAQEQQQSESRAAESPSSSSRVPTTQPTTAPASVVAASTPDVACQVEKGVDIILVIDKSGSMKSATSSTDKTPRFTRVKEAAKRFVSKLGSKNKTMPVADGHKAGLVSFANVKSSDTSTVSRLDSPLTTSLASVNSKIDTLTADGGTCMQCGVRFANAELKAKSREGVKKVVILLTDGRPTHKASGQVTVPAVDAEKAAYDEALLGTNSIGTIFYTIGVGTNVNKEFLTQFAKATGGQYYFVPSASDLDAIYNKIAIDIVKGTVKGTVFNDKNGNKLKDSGDAGLLNWKVTVRNASTKSAVASAMSDKNGNFTFNDICDGSYTLGLTLQSGWKRIEPTSATGYTFSITKGNTFSGALFAVQIIPTPTVTPKPTATRTPTPTLTLTPTPTTIPKPSITFSGNPTHVDFNGTSTLTWTSTNTTSCTASGNWSGSKSTSGSQSTGGLSQTNTFALSCTGPGGSTTKTVTITVGDAPTSTPTLTPTQTPTPTLTLTPTVTPTPLPNHTVLTLDLLFNDIGIGGANPNPKPLPCQRASFSATSCLSNQDPLHPQRPVRVSVFDTTNKLVAEKNGIVSYDTFSGTFKGTIDMDLLSSGNYYVKVKSDYQLQRLIPGVHAIQAEKVNNLPQAAFVGGNANKDSALTILDYTMLIGCYSDDRPAVACDPQKKLATDFNDDGKVDFSDYNLFIRNLSVQNED